MKKLLILATLIIQTSVFIKTTSAFYSDVPETHQYYQEIKFLYENDLLPKTNNNLFKPNEKLTKANFYQILLTYGKAEINNEVRLPFNDTNNNSEYGPYIQTALDLGLVHANSLNPSFSPDKFMAKHSVLQKMFQSLGVGTSYFFDKSSYPFFDLDKNSEIAPIAQTAYNLGIIEKTEPNRFWMAKRITNGETAFYLFQILQNNDGESSNIQATIIPKSPNLSPIDSSITEQEEFQTLVNVWEILNNSFYYQENIEESDLLYGAIIGMVERANDDYTIFQEPIDAQDFLDQINNEFVGVGISIEQIDNQIVIVSPLKNSPAESAGILPNDIITKVNDESIEGKGIDYVISKIKGPINTNVKLTVKRGGIEIGFDIIRKLIQIETVEYELINKSNKKIAHIELFNFGGNSRNEFYSASEQAINDNVHGIILDLRNNPGGYLDYAIGMLSLFTDKQETATEIRNSDGKKSSYKTNGNGLLKDIQTVVLINEGSASASEILAGGLQDWELATLIGTNSFGKGSVQDVIQYIDGSIFKYTVSNWTTPNGRNINQIGLEPDIFIEENPDTEINEQLERALLEF